MPFNSTGGTNSMFSSFSVCSHHVKYSWTIRNEPVENANETCFLLLQICTSTYAYLAFWPVLINHRPCCPVLRTTSGQFWLANVSVMDLDARGAYFHQQYKLLGWEGEIKMGCRDAKRTRLCGTGPGDGISAMRAERLNEASVLYFSVLFLIATSRSCFHFSHVVQCTFVHAQAHR